MKTYSIYQTQYDELDYVRFFENNESVDPTQSKIIYSSTNKEETKEFFDKLNNCVDDMYTEFSLWESEEYDEGEEDFEAIYIEMDRKEFDVPLKKINPKAIIVKWSWQTHVGYSRKLELIEFAEYFGIENERDLITGNIDSVYSPNFSLLIENAEDYTNEDLYTVLLQELDNDWKWTNSFKSELDCFFEINNFKK